MQKLVLPPMPPDANRAYWLAAVILQTAPRIILAVAVLIRMIQR